MIRWIGLSLLGIVLTTGTVAAQITTPPSAPKQSTTTTSNKEAFDSQQQQVHSPSSGSIATGSGRNHALTNKGDNFFALLAIALGIRRASAQNPNQGAFDKLLPVNQEIAQALFEAQRAAGNSGKAGSLTRDDIAAMRQQGKRWGEIFQEMKARELVREKDLGQVVSKFTRQQRGPLARRRRSPQEATRGRPG